MTTTPDTNEAEMADLTARLAPPPKANFAFDFAKPPPAAPVREDEIVVRREDFRVALRSYASPSIARPIRLRTTIA